MQNQILGFFIVTTIALGALCGVQWHHARQHRHQAVALRVKVEDNAIEMDGLHSNLRTLKSDQDRIKSEQMALTGLVAKLAQSTNALAREVQTARAEAVAVWPISNDPAHRAWAAAIRTHWAGNPGALDLMQLQQSWLLSAMGGVLARDTTLPPEERARLNGLLVEDRMKRIQAQLHAANHPLLDAQDRQLREAITEVQDRQVSAADPAVASAKVEPPSSESRLLKHQQLQELESQALLDRARSFLDDDQLKALSAFQTNHLQVLRLGLELVREAMRSSGG